MLRIQIINLTKGIMMISKVVTKNGAAGRPVSVELGTVVVSMRSETVRKAVA